ncbi:hypothetical protein BZG36_05497 [Bifiguratus adelaidae]|uniref:EF-hand domain-containing protein n=1 Tax=Bifiguratus adelaidae TaxID=1938954 RepID=A0A261XTA1_9FUNG|nr:hypothetical protein BZG36_05497 [Bifiguratus adelaidae]
MFFKKTKNADVYYSSSTTNPEQSEELNKEQLMSVNETFKLLDEQNKGYITGQDVIAAASRIGLDVSDQTPLVSLGKIDAQQFEIIMATQFAEGSESGVLDAFQLFDRAGQGQIDANDLKKLMSAYGESLTDAEVEAMVKEADVDGDGKVNFEEFHKIMTQLENPSRYAISTLL